MTERKYVPYAEIAQQGRRKQSDRARSPEAPKQHAAPLDPNDPSLPKSVRDMARFAANERQETQRVIDDIRARSTLSPERHIRMDTYLDKLSEITTRGMNDLLSDYRQFVERGDKEKA